MGCYVLRKGDIQCARSTMLLYRLAAVVGLEFTISGMQDIELLILSSTN